jgi:hypothetical protein
LVDLGDGNNRDDLHNQLHWTRKVSKDPNDKVNGVFGGLNPPGNDRTWDSIWNAFTLLKHLKLIERFVDPRNPETDQEALPDGMNIDSGILRASWALHRAWIRALHYRSLYTGEDSVGWDQIKQIIKLAYAFHESENVNVPKERRQRHEFALVYKMYNDVAQALGAMNKELFQETRPQLADEAYTPAETVIYNLQHDRFEALFLKVRASFYAKRYILTIK